nr:hypothetical protein [Rhizobium smilacinae]
MTATLFRMAPADESLRADNTACRQIDLRLIMKLEFPGREGAADIVGKTALLVGALAERRAELGIGLPAAYLCFMKGEQGGSEHSIGIIEPIWPIAQDAADAGAEMGDESKDRKWLLETPTDNGRSLWNINAVFKQNPKFIASEPGNDRISPDTLADPVGRLLEDGVAGGHAHRSVHLAQTVQTNLQDREFRSCLQRLFDQFEKPRAVRQVGETIEGCQILPAATGGRHQTAMRGCG